MARQFTSTTPTDRYHKILTFVTTRWPECALAIALLAGVIVSGCKSGYCWRGPEGHMRYTSDPPESYPAAERVNAHPAEWR